MSTGRRVLQVAKRVAIALAYLLILVAVALGSAGIVAMWSHPPGTAARAELTWHGDSTLTPHLDAAQTDLADVAASVDRLALLARGALAALNSTDHAAFSSALADGSVRRRRRPGRLDGARGLGSRPCRAPTPRRRSSTAATCWPDARR